MPRGVLSLDLPMHQMGARMARFFAESMGMRLLNPEEWERASRTISAESGHFWSESWAAMISEKLRSELMRGSFYQGPHSGTSGTADRAESLLVPVNSGAGGIMHLAGNIAEFIFDHDSGRYYVVGGSALVQADNTWRKPLEVEHGDLNYSDVGLRLAFDAPLKAPHARYLAILEKTWNDLI
jgi:hypothetical protein